MRNPGPLSGSDYSEIVKANELYAKPRFEDGTNNAIIRDLYQTYLCQRGDRSFTREKAEREGRFLALLSVLEDRLPTRQPTQTPLRADDL